MKLRMEPIERLALPGLQVHRLEEAGWLGEAHFRCYPFPHAACHGGAVRGDWICARPAPLRFHRLEWHPWPETAYFLSGAAVMPFVCCDNGVLLPETARLAEIPAGTQVVIGAGLAHAVPIARGREPVSALYVLPEMESVIIPLDRPIEAQESGEGTP